MNWKPHPEPALDTMRSVGRGPKSHPLRWALGTTVAIVAFSWTWSQTRQDQNELAAPPAEIVGTWTTTHPRYSDRGFTITLDRLEILVGPSEAQVYPIRSISREESEGGTSYVIVYPTGEGTLTHAMVVDERGEARLQNLEEVVWVRR